MSTRKFGLMGCVLVLVIPSLSTPRCAGQFIDYAFEGVITEVNANESNVIPGLSIGDDFTGSVRFDSQGWNFTAGIISVSLNGVDLRFEGDYIFGEMSLSFSEGYSLRIQADSGGDIRNSTFSAGNFGLDLEDFQYSDLYDETYPVFLGPEAYEKNEFKIVGSVLASMNFVDAVGELTSLDQIVVDCFGDTNGDFVTDVSDINGFADVLGESALFNRCFDINDDGVISLDDHDLLVENWVSVSPDVNGTFVGDLNLDGSVDVLNDAFTLVRNLGRSGVYGFEDGDLDADGRVDVLGDGFRFVENLGKSIHVGSQPAVVSVPEPNAFLLLVFGTTVLSSRRCRLTV